jgi:hypothetical protein
MPRSSQNLTGLGFQSLSTSSELSSHRDLFDQPLQWFEWLRFAYFEPRHLVNLGFCNRVKQNITDQQQMIIKRRYHYLAMN